MRVLPAVFVLLSVIAASTHAPRAVACAADEDNVCDFKTENVCRDEFQPVCQDVNVCSDPNDTSTCHNESQCHYEWVSQCHTESNMVCECAPRPAVDPGSGGSCATYQCTPCASHQKYCGYWDSCRSAWSSGGGYEGCAG